MAISQNGYSANNINVTSVRTIPGTGRKIRLRSGPAGDLLTWVLAQFHARVEDIDDGQLDDWGYAERPIRGSTTVLSNHASGTAADVNALKHPQGTNPSANFTRTQVDTIHAIIGQTEGCVRWGGDYTAPAPKDGMHFEIIQNETRCAQVLAKLTQQGDDIVTPEEIKAIGAAVWDSPVRNKSNGNNDPARESLGWTLRGIDVANAKLDALTTAVANLAADPDITPETLAQMLDDSIAKHVQITGTVEIGSKP